MSSIWTPTAKEQDLSNRLRELAIEEVERRGRAEASLALGLTEMGLDRLLWEPRWNLEKAFRVADLLGLEFLKLTPDESAIQTQGSQDGWPRWWQEKVLDSWLSGVLGRMAETREDRNALRHHAS